MTDTEYHQVPYIGSSMLKELAKSPAHLWANYLDPNRERDNDTPALLMGRAVHCLSLEPQEFDARFVEMPDGIDRRTKAGKDFWIEFEDKHQGKKVLDAKAMQTVRKTADAIRKHPLAEMALTGGRAESTLLWEEPQWGVQCKARLDYEINTSETFPLGLISDVKTTQDASPRGFERSAYNYGYHIQAAWYQRGFMVTHGTSEPPPFAFFAVEKEAPFACTVFRASDEFIARGWEECKRLVALYQQCVTNNHWPAYTEQAVTLHLPRWAANDNTPFTLEPR